MVVARGVLLRGPHSGDPTPGAALFAGATQFMGLDL